MRKYEGMFIIKSELEEKLQDKAIDSINESIAKNGGKVINSEKWGKRKLAYPIENNREGLYCRFEFEIAPDSIPALKMAFKLNDDIVRELLIVKE